MLALQIFCHYFAAIHSIPTLSELLNDSKFSSTRGMEEAV